MFDEEEDDEWAQEIERLEEKAKYIKDNFKECDLC
jgi:hypothetical protein